MFSYSRIDSCIARSILDCDARSDEAGGMTDRIYSLQRKLESRPSLVL